MMVKTTRIRRLLPTKVKLIGFIHNEAADGVAARYGFRVELEEGLSVHFIANEAIFEDQIPDVTLGQTLALILEVPTKDIDDANG